MELGVFCSVGVGLGFCTDGRGAGVTEPFVVGGSEGLFCSGVPFRTAVAPSRALAAPLIENAGA